MDATNYSAATERLRKLDLPASSMKPTEWIVDDYVDSTGEDALRVIVVVEDGLESVDGSAIIHVKEAIRESLLDEGIDRYAYIWFTTASELVSMKTTGN